MHAYYTRTFSAGSQILLWILRIFRCRVFLHDFRTLSWQEAKKDKELHQKEPISDTLTSAWKYFLSRIKSIYPFYFAAVGFFCILNIILKHTKLLNSILYFISDLLFLQIFSFPSISYTGTVWFLAALFFSLFVLYPIVRRYYDVYIKYFSLPIVLLNMGYVMRILHSFEAEPFLTAFLSIREFFEQ